MTEHDPATCSGCQTLRDTLPNAPTCLEMWRRARDASAALVGLFDQDELNAMMAASPSGAMSLPQLMAATLDKLRTPDGALALHHQMLRRDKARAEQSASGPVVTTVD